MKRRVTVMSPQTRLAMTQRRHDRPWRRPQLDPVTAERAVIIYRRQLARAVTALALLFVMLFGLPLVLAVWPELDRVRIAGVPVSWLMLAVLPYPAMVVLGRWQLRRAEAAEAIVQATSAGHQPPAEVVERLGPVAMRRAEPSRVESSRIESSRATE